MLIEEWELLDALYMTCIIITTIGFKEVRELSDSGRIFTLIFAIINFIILAGSLSIISSAIVEGRIIGIYRRRRMLREISKMKKHIIVCGAGKIGKHVIRELFSHGKHYVVIDENTDMIEHLQTAEGGRNRELPALVGNPTREEILLAAGIENAEGLVACMPEDAQNIFIAMTAKKLNPKLRIVSQAGDEVDVPKFFMVGVDEVVSGDFIIGRKLAMGMLASNVTAFLDQVNFLNGKETLYLGDADIPMRSRFAGKALRDAGIPQATGVLVIAIRKHGSSEFLFNPTSETILEAGDALIFMGSNDNQVRLRKYLSA
jgi:voltage-gated potassium channel